MVCVSLFNYKSKCVAGQRNFFMQRFQCLHTTAKPAPSLHNPTETQERTHPAPDLSGLPTYLRSRHPTGTAHCTIQYRSSAGPQSRGMAVQTGPRGYGRSTATAASPRSTSAARCQEKSGTLIQLDTEYRLPIQATSCRQTGLAPAESILPLGRHRLCTAYTSTCRQKGRRDVRRFLEVWPVRHVR